MPEQGTYLVSIRKYPVGNQHTDAERALGLKKLHEAEAGIAKIFKKHDGRIKKVHERSGFIDVVTTEEAAALIEQLPNIKKKVRRHRVLVIRQPS